MRTKHTLTLADANVMMAWAKRAAVNLGRAVTIAVVDDAGALLQAERMDGARAYSVDLALRKARAAAAVGVSTQVIEAMSRGAPASEANPGQGGAPYMFDGQCAGGIGVSGALPAQDEEIAAAGLAALAQTETGLTP
jgi:glc operon protein GlcG